MSSIGCPGLPQWIPALVALVVLLGVNLIAVGVFGEFEFWFAIIKVVTIIGMILLGLAIILFGVSALGDTRELLEPVVARMGSSRRVSAGRFWLCRS